MTFEILTTTGCRWSIRNIVALSEKGADFRLVNVAEGDHKAGWYHALTPFGKTPALRHRGAIIVESRLINEYVDESTPGRRLLPADPLKRAWARIWNSYCDEELMKHVQLAVASGQSVREKALADLDTGLERLERYVFVHAEQGIFWGGARISLTDICYWTLFDTLERMGGFLSPRRLLDSRPTLCRWSEEVRAYPGFHQAASQLDVLDS